MPLGEVVGHVLVEVVLELLIKGPGFFIARLFKEDVDPDGAWSIVVGLLFWGLLGGLGYFLYGAVAG